jgi:malate/lactate dehydrogenase
MGVPCILSDQGVEKILELNLNEQEIEMFNVSAQSVHDDIDKIS